MDNKAIINEIRSKIDIVDLISEYVPLTQKGKNYFGVCPFHNDTNPSMSVSREKQIYKCFSCGASGNVFTFVSEYENISFREALELLADKIGYKLDHIKHKEVKNINTKYYDMYDLTAKFFQNNINSSTGKKAREYLKKRNISDEIIKKFSIGLSLEKSNALIEILIKKGYPIKDIVNLGLAVEDHDVFIDRIMFPLHDTNGRIVGFSGRIYDNSSKNKYLNTKETEIFKKGQCLYNYHIAKDATRQKGYLIIMEGFMDVIRASTIGYDNVVALMGTALTSNHLTLIKKLSLNVILCFDGDAAGEKATINVGEQLEKIGIIPKVIALTNNDDPDTYILKYGNAGFSDLVNSALSFNDYKINRLKNGVNFSSDVELSNYVDKVLQETSNINDEIRREIIVKKLAIDTNLSYNTLEKRLNEYLQQKKDTKVLINLDKKETKRQSRYEKAVYALVYNMMQNSEVIEKCKKENLSFVVSNIRHLVNEILGYYDKFGTISIADMYTCLAEKKELLAIVNDVMIKDDYDCSSEAIDDYISVIKDYNSTQEIKRLENIMKNEIDLTEKSKIAEQIRMLKLVKIGESNHG